MPWFARYEGIIPHINNAITDAEQIGNLEEAARLQYDQLHHLQQRKKEVEDEISERHRQWYEVYVSYSEGFEELGFHFSGMSPDNVLPEVIESVNHKWFIGVQFHPELKSRPLAPHPLFSSFIKNCIKWK